MATITVAAPNFSLVLDELDFSTVSGLSNPLAGGFSLDFNDGSRWDVAGTGFAYGGPNGLPSAGTIASITFIESGDAESGSAIGLAMPATDFAAFVNTSDEAGFVSSLLSGNDTLIGGDAADELRGDAGTDLLVGSNGNDTLNGEDGVDLIIGDFAGGSITIGGADSIFGGTGSDHAAAGLGDDTVSGDAGADWLDGGANDDTLYGGDGDDAALGAAGDDVVLGGEGNDYSDGGQGTDTLASNTGEDWLDGAEGDDLLLAGDGNDIVLGAPGEDVIEAGAGNDVANGGGGDDILQGGNGDDLLQGDDAFTGNGDDTLYGGDGSDIAFGGAGNDGLYGGAGADLLSGDDGDDTLAGGTGNDLLFGGAGSDTVIYAGSITTIGSSGGVVTINAGADGIDTLIGVETILQNQPLVFDLTSLGQNLGFIIQGDTQGDTAGRSVASAGDFNGDGYEDVIVGAFRGDDVANSSGEAYIVFGSALGFGSAIVNPETGELRRVVDLTSLSPTQGLIIQGDFEDGQAGIRATSAGDVNGDGFSDVIVGARFAQSDGTYAGEAYVVFGAAAGVGVAVLNTDTGFTRQVVDVASLQPAHGFIIFGDNDSDRAGSGVSSAGDINGDGFDDFMVAAASNDDGGAGAGDVYVLFGGAGPFGSSDGGGRSVIKVESLTSAQGFIIQGDAAGDDTGSGISSAGDVNGDGFADLIVGADFGDDGGSDAGEAYVVFGSVAGFGVPVLDTETNVMRQVVDLTSLGSLQGFIIQGDTASDAAGVAVSSAGDINGDGFDDLIVGAVYRGSNHAGAAYVVFGAGSGFGTATFDSDSGQTRQVIDLTSLSPAQGFIIRGETAGDYAGISVASAGDFNGDGYADLIVGAEAANGGTGAAYVLFGSAGLFGTATLNTETGQPQQVVLLSSLSAQQGFAIHGDSAEDLLGRSVGAAGDVNGDGFDDLIVGAQDGDDGGDYAGEAYVVFGAAFGSGTPIVALGGIGKDFLIGDRGADTLSGGGGADVIRGGAGNDLITARDLAFTDINGGTGIDTLVFDGTSQTLDLAAVLPERLQSIERIDIGGTGNDVVRLDTHTVFDLTEERGTGRPAVAVLGDAGDGVQIDVTGAETWTLVGSAALGGVTFNRYQWDADGGGAIVPMANAELWLDQDLALAFI